MHSFEDGSFDDQPAAPVNPLKAILKRFLGRESVSAEPTVALSELPKGDYRDIDARRAAARKRLGRELADFVEFF